MSFRENYTVTLTTQSPTHIGCGEVLNKKEYIRLPRENRVLVVDMPKLYAQLKNKGLNHAFEEYFTDHGNAYRDLKQMLDRLLPSASPGNQRVYEQVAKYSLSCGDAFSEQTPVKAIAKFVRNAYGEPYIPGSSLKGALRTAVLATVLHASPKDYSNFGTGWHAGGNIRHDKTADKIEEKALRKLGFADQNGRIKSAINDVFRAVSISDSDALKNSDLVLCQKIDVATDGKENSINTLRECLQPEVRIKFSLSIDTQMFKYLSPHAAALDYIKSCIKIFSHMHNEFDRKFTIGNVLPSQRGDDSITLGGGTGYQTKTFAYPLYGEGAISKVAECLHTQFRKHGHQNDMKKGASPHMLKCTRYNNTLYKMGVCELKFEKETP